MTSFQEASGKLLEEAWWKRGGKRGGSVVEARFGGIGSVKLPERQEAWILGRVRGSKFRKRDSMQASGKNPLGARFRGRNRGGGDASATLILGENATLGLPFSHKHAHSPTFKQRDEKPHLQVLVFSQQIKTSPSKEFHQRITRKQLALSQKSLLKRGTSFQRALARVKQMQCNIPWVLS